MERYFKNYNAEDYIRDISAIVEAARRNGLKVCFDPLGQLLIVENTTYTMFHGDLKDGYGAASLAIPTDDYFAPDLAEMQAKY